MTPLKRFIPASVKAIALTTILIMSVPAFAWGPATQQSIVSASGHLFSRNSAIPLSNLMEFVVEGSRLSAEEDRELYLGFEVDPVQSIQREMFLLQGVKSNRIDPYFAYRLGALGKKVVQHVAPMRDADASVRAQYYADVDEQITRVRLTNASRNLVDPASYFAILNRQSQENNRTILVDYRSGLGIKGIAGAGLSRDASRAVDAVADVWFTIFQANVDIVDISRSDMRDFMLDSVEYYVKSNRIGEIRDVYTRAGEKGLLDQEMQQTIGNLYYDNGYYKEALAVYDDLLEDNPRIPEVNKRIADYHVEQGKKFLADGDLEEAERAFQSGVDADLLSDDAQRNLVMTSREIEKRDTRFGEQKIFNETAKQSEMEAEAADRARDYVQAIQYLADARDRYSAVTEEFPALAREASVGLRNVEIQLDQMKGSLVANAQLLSGSGFAYDARQLANTSTPLPTDALRSLLKSDYENALDALPNLVDNN